MLVCFLASQASGRTPSLLNILAHIPTPDLPRINLPISHWLRTQFHLNSESFSVTQPGTRPSSQCAENGRLTASHVVTPSGGGAAANWVATRGNVGPGYLDYQENWKDYIGIGYLLPNIMKTSGYLPCSIWTSFDDSWADHEDKTWLVQSFQWPLIHPRT